MNSFVLIKDYKMKNIFICKTKLFQALIFIIIFALQPVDLNVQNNLNGLKKDSASDIPAREQAIAHVSRAVHDYFLFN